MSITCSTIQALLTPQALCHTGSLFASWSLSDASATADVASSAVRTPAQLGPRRHAPVPRHYTWTRKYNTALSVLAVA